MRELDGKDLSSEQIQARIRATEERLAGKEEELAEKEASFQAMVTLTEKLKLKAERKNDAALSIAKQVRHFVFSLTQTVCSLS